MFVGRSMSAVNPPPRMAVIRRSDMKLLDEVDLLFPRPHGIVVHPAGDVVYVASLGTNQIASVGVEQGEVRLIDVAGQRPRIRAGGGLARRKAARRHRGADRFAPDLRSEPTRRARCFRAAWRCRTVRSSRPSPATDAGSSSPRSTPIGSPWSTPRTGRSTVLPEHAGYGQPHGDRALARRLAGVRRQSPPGRRRARPRRRQADRHGHRRRHLRREPRGGHGADASAITPPGSGMTPARPGATATSRPCR